MSFMKIGGRKDNDTAVGLAATDEGALKTAKTWQNELLSNKNSDGDVTSTWVLNATNIQAGTPKLSRKVSLGDAAAVSLRVHNTTGLTCKLTFYWDGPGGDTNEEPGTNYVLRDANGNYVQFTVPKASAAPYFIITPDDLPILQWLRFLWFKVEFTEAPAANTSLKIAAIVKR